MKKFFYTLVGISCFAFAGCNEEVIVNLDVPGANNYSLLYIPQAIDGVIEKRFSITEERYQLAYSAFLGGSLPNDQDIHVKFGVLPETVNDYNLKHGTNYAIMPEGSYTLESPEVVIKSGTNSSGVLNISVQLLGYTLPFESYLLPISIIEADAELNTSLNTVYYLITGSYAPGEVPRELAYSFGSDAGHLMIDFHGDLIRRAGDGTLLLYPGEPNGSFGQPRQIGEDWWGYIDLFFLFGEDRILGRWAINGNISQFYIDRNGNFGADRVIGWGWFDAVKIIPYKNLVLAVVANGTMTMFPLDAQGNWDFGAIRAIGWGWTAPHIIPYQNSLLAIETNGDMYQYPLSVTGDFGARSHVGSGWDKFQYVLVFSAGTDLLALDDNGDLWRYRFNPAGFWPL